ncbi:MAG: flagellar biosynthesis anti-sigma factor FlgM [Oleispira antarctica]|nr:flagellar biosynthesis anti-sigma factor FlgM [Oleispira antarctica]MBQ0794198.1 flagellar biosynthesis anti-sigma factor FlgM [Oleispira antarctica]
MNINKLTSGLDGGSRAKTDAASQQNQKPEENTKSTSSVGSGDQVKLSSSSMNIQQIEAEVSKMPDVDDKTIDRIRSAIDNGEYKIDYQQLAGKMLDFEGKLN